ncbi:MerR family DNA-binding transcriptional regulator [Kitasatospora nipponensis]|uniref:MerR family DNA-binding transcriptional regulator n=1 Tax=Kitasatospora nipponensis TaxID=258049 RepID=A0ABN1VUF6_9ACTN
MRSIGQLAQESGLTVSALRFYDGAGVFGPAWVDPQTGYRWYAPEQLADARLVCRLRRVGLPLAEIRLVLTAAGDAAVAGRVLDAHLRRLEDGLADARRELSAVRVLLDQREHLMTSSTDSARNAAPTAVRLRVHRAGLAAALAAVRFAVSADPAFPMLGGVLFDLPGELLRLVATDRHRLAVAQTPLLARTAEGTAVVAGDDRPELGFLVPTALADAIGALAAGGGGDADGGGDELLTLTVEGGRLSAEVGGRRAEGHCLELDFPDYRRLVELAPTHRVETTADALRRAVTDGATRSTAPTTTEAGDGSGPAAEVTVLAVSDDGALRVLERADEVLPDGEPYLRVAVNREFLLEALDAGAPGQLVLELGGPISPLAIRPAAHEQGAFSLLMPVRLS